MKFSKMCSKIYLLMSLLLKLCDCHKNFEMDMVEKIILKQDYPKQVCAFLCQRNQGDLDMLKRLSANNVPTSVYNHDTRLPEHLHNILFVLDLSCNFSLSVLEQANERNLFKAPYRWILFGNDDSENRFKSLFSFNIELDSCVIVSTKSDDDSYAIDAVYKLEAFSEFLVTRVGTYTNNSIAYQDVILHRLRKNVLGTVVRTALMFTDNSSLNHLWSYRDDHIDTISKLNYVFVWILYDMLNATRQFSVQSVWGYKSKDSNYFSGMVGELQNRSADIGGCALFVTRDRISVIDYIAPTTKTYASFIFRAPPLSYVSNIFTLPFNRAVWISSMLLILFAMMSLVAILRWESAAKFENSREQNVSDVSLMAVGAVCQQGTEFVPRSTAGRICLFFMLLSMMFICTAYSANIVALLQSTTTSISSLSKLLESRLSVGVHDVSYSFHYFKAAQDPIRKALYEQKVAPGGKLSNFMSMEKGIALMRNGYYAFHVETGPGYKLVGETFEENEKCGLQEIRFIDVVSPWLAIQKNSTYKEVLKIGLRLIHESGIRNREINRLYAKKPVCLHTGRNFISVGFLDCYAAFLIFAIGCGIAFLLLLFELIYRMYLVNYCTRDTPLTIEFSN